MERGQTFDAVAAAYDAQRTGYVSKLFADVVAYAALKPRDRVLEIGCGSGQATVGFLAEGLDVTGVDPGASLIGLAREKFIGAELVRFEVSTFEQWEREGRQFELVAAGQSWHWVRADLGFAKAASALSPRGVLAIFGHTPAWSIELLACLEPVYRRLVPSLWGAPPEAWYLPDGPVRDQIQASGLFGRVEHREYEWRRRYSAASFAAYLGTRSDYLLLPESLRRELLSNVEKAVPAAFEADWVTNLYMAQRVRP